MFANQFLEDNWLNGSPLRYQFPILYNIARHKDKTLAEVLSSNPPNISFCRALIGLKLVAWSRLLAYLELVNLNDEDGRFVLSLHRNGKFSVHV